MCGTTAARSPNPKQGAICARKNLLSMVAHQHYAHIWVHNIPWRYLHDKGKN